MIKNFLRRLPVSTSTSRPGSTLPLGPSPIISQVAANGCIFKTERSSSNYYAVAQLNGQRAFVKIRSISVHNKKYYCTCHIFSHSIDLFNEPRLNRLMPHKTEAVKDLVRHCTCVTLAPGTEATFLISKLQRHFIAVCQFVNGNLLAVPVLNNFEHD
jgi:hypothetical protein